MEIKIEIPTSKIVDAMTSVMEGNDMTVQWCHGIYLRGLWEQRNNRGEAGDHWYCHAPIFDGDFTIEVYEITDEGNDFWLNGGDYEDAEAFSKAAVKRGCAKSHRISRDDFIKGLQLMAKKNPYQFGQFMQDDGGDAITADVFLQFVALGEERYG